MSSCSAVLVKISGGAASRHCPFLGVAESQKAVVCPIHLGLMQGALETWQAPVTVERLDAFVEPDLCLVNLGRRVATT
jgi:predicted ArsR family transcriptional regulator